jgi:hypothetical protein
MLIRPTKSLLNKGLIVTRLQGISHLQQYMTGLITPDQFEYIKFIGVLIVILGYFDTQFIELEVAFFDAQ